MEALAFLYRQPKVETKTNQNLLRRDFSEKLCEVVEGTVTTHLQYFSGLKKEAFLSRGRVNKAKRSHL